MILSFADADHRRHAGRGTRSSPRAAIDTRPTSDRVRENVFNLVGPVDGATVLDLFAGSGALGIEALSRGAARRRLRRERRGRGARDRAEPREAAARPARASCCGDAVAALAQEATAGAKYDLVLVDPPYDMYPDIQPSSRAICPPSSPRTASLVVETDARIEPELPLPLRTSRKYGQARVTLFEADA